MKLGSKYIILKLFIILLFITGVIYPVLVNIIGQILFPYQANGSLFIVGNNIVGSKLVGQNFTSDKYFHPRPSYAGEGYNALTSGSSSFALTNKKFYKLTLEKYNLLNKKGRYFDITSDEIFSSSSGLDPYISIYYAYSQLERIAKIRGIKYSKLQDIINEHIEKTFFGIIGNPRINVLVLNSYLDRYINLK